MWIGIRNTVFVLANLRFADWDTKDIFGFVSCELIITFLLILDLRTGTPQQFADLRLRKKPKEFAGGLRQFLLLHAPLPFVGYMAIVLGTHCHQD
jgi:hypothetical protein